jgi:hypothetical protein
LKWILNERLPLFRTWLSSNWCTLNCFVFSNQNNVANIWFYERGSERRISLLRRAVFSIHRKCLFSSSLLRHQNIKSVFLVDHNYKIDKDQNIEIDKYQNIEIDKDHYYKSSWSLLRKSEREKEWKEHGKSQFCLIFKFWLPMAYGVLVLTNKS